MSYKEKTDQMDWKDEFSWMGIAFIAGLILSILFTYYERFPGASNMLVAIVSCFSFYVLSILLRIQNHRGQLLIGKTIIAEGKLKVIFPVVGLTVGIALLVF